MARGRNTILIPFIITLVGGVMVAEYYRSYRAPEVDVPAWLEHASDQAGSLAWLTEANGRDRLSVEVRVRRQGENTWHDRVSATPGETLQWVVAVLNWGADDAHHVSASGLLPPHLVIEPESTRWYTASYTDGLALDFDRFNIAYGAGGYDFGNYAPGGGLLIRFDTRVTGGFTECAVDVRNIIHTRSTENVEVDDVADVRITRC